MKPDLYTKAVLTVIAIMLTAVACNQYINPKATAQAQSAAPVQFSMSPRGPAFFDARSGEIWQYGFGQTAGMLLGKYRLTKPGSPLAVDVDQ